MISEFGLTVLDDYRVRAAGAIDKARAHATQSSVCALLCSAKSIQRCKEEVSRSAVRAVIKYDSVA
jgi:hypothetical protein